MMWMPDKELEEEDQEEDDELEDSESDDDNDEVLDDLVGEFISMSSFSRSLCIKLLISSSAVSTIA
jgi:hypothetical protein